MHAVEKCIKELLMIARLIAQQFCFFYSHHIACISFLESAYCEKRYQKQPLWQDDDDDGDDDDIVRKWCLRCKYASLFLLNTQINPNFIQCADGIANNMELSIFLNARLDWFGGGKSREFSQFFLYILIFRGFSDLF